MNQSTAQRGVQINSLDAAKGHTRFHELHPDLQAMIQSIDDKFQGQMSNAGRIREILPGQGDKVASIEPDVNYVEQFLSTVELGLDNDSANIAQLKELVKKDADDASLSFRAITNHALPQQFHYRNANLTASTTKSKTSAAAADSDDDPTKPVDLVSYFSKRSDELSTTLDVYQRQIREIEAHLRTMEAGTLEKAHQLAGSRSGVRDQRRELVDALKAMEGAILECAKKVGQTRDVVTQRTLGSVGGTVL